MNEKMARIERLLGLGWDVDDIVSDDRAVEVLLRRGPSRTKVVLDTQDAWEVLRGDVAARTQVEDVVLAPPH